MTCTGSNRGAQRAFGSEQLAPRCGPHESQARAFLSRRRQMRVGLTGAGVGRLATPDALEAFVTKADELGFGTVWLAEHVLLVNSFSSPYPYLSKEDPSDIGMAMDVDFLNPY